MKRAPYRERDYAFGQAMLILRTAIGLTQNGLADFLTVSRRAVGEWESGGSYPKPHHLKKLIALGVKQGAFSAGEAETEIRKLWKIARQKVLLDEAWLAEILGAEMPVSVSAPTRRVEQTNGGSYARPPQVEGKRFDWGDALAVPAFYGREWEMGLLSEWVVAHRCPVVSVLGVGGIGKSSISVSLMHRVAAHFDVVIWRSLRDAPDCEALIENCLQVIAPHTLSDISPTLDHRLNILIDYLRTKRVLLVLDNVEVLLEEGEGAAQVRSPYEGYVRLLCRIAETEHQSCLLLTSREKLSDLIPFEGKDAPVRTLHLARLDVESCQQLLSEKGVRGSAAECNRLIEIYTGNPLALKIVAQTIVDLFDGEIGLFLEQGCAG